MGKKVELDEVRRLKFMIFLAQRAYDRNPGTSTEFLLKQIGRTQQKIDVILAAEQTKKRKVKRKKRK